MSFDLLIFIFAYFSPSLLVLQTESESVNSKLCYGCGAAAMYKCPGCALGSCSLACVRKHKVSSSSSTSVDVRFCVVWGC